MQESSTSNTNKKETTVASSNSILRKISELYTDPSKVDADLGEMGLTKIGEVVQETVYAPRKKVTVMFIGNHSAGKSSFINWYIGDKIMPTVRSSHHLSTCL